MHVSVCSVCAEPEIKLDYTYQHPRSGDTEVLEGSWRVYPPEEHSIDVVVHLIVDVRVKQYREKEGKDMPEAEVEQARSWLKSWFQSLLNTFKGADPQAALRLGNEVTKLLEWAGSVGSG